MSEDRLPNLIKDLKRAVDECWVSKIEAYEIAKKNAHLCVQIIEELGYMPHLTNYRLEKRRKETDGMDYWFEDFWSHEDMIIALFEHLEKEEFKHAST